MAGCSRRVGLGVLLVAALLLQACSKPKLGKPGELGVVRPVAGADGPLMAAGPDGREWPVVELVPEEDPLAVSVRSLATKQFAAEVLKTHAAVRLNLAGRKSLAPALAGALKAPVLAVLGASPSLPGQGVFLAVGDKREPFPDALWVAIPPEEAQADTGALEQSLAGRLGELNLALMMDETLQRMGERSMGGPLHPWLITNPTRALLHGYGLHVESLARRYSRSGKLNASLNAESPDKTNARVAAISTNRYQFQPPPPADALKTAAERTAFISRWASLTPPLKGIQWRGAQMVGIPGVVATVLNQTAEDANVALEPPRPDVLASFMGGKVPKDFDPKTLHATALAEMKFLHAAHARLTAKEGINFPGITTLMEGLGAEFPETRQAAMTTLLTVTGARTATTGSMAGLDGAAAAMKVTQEVLAGTQFPDGAVGPAIMVRLDAAAFPWSAKGAPQPLIFNLNAAMPWQLEAIPGMLAEDVQRVHARLEKGPLLKVDELAGTIPAESFAALQAASR